MYTRVSTQHAPPQRTTDMDLPPLFDLSLAEREETLEEQPQAEGAAAAAAAAPKPARVNPQTVAAASQVAAGSIGSVLASAAMAASTPSPSAVAAAAAASSAAASHSQQQQLHPPQPSAPPPSASLDFPPADGSADGGGEGFGGAALDEDLYGTRMSLPSFVSSILASPRALSDRAGFELELLQNLAAAPEVQNQIYREATIIPEMMKKNRYSNVIPNRASRVILPSASSNPADSYINACSLPPLLGGSIQSYIACQAPLPHTMSDFWHMVWTQQTPLIVMLTKTAERDARGNVIHKAHSYWPEPTEQTADGQAGKPNEDSLPSVRFAPYTVTLLSTHQEPELIIRELLLTYDGGVDGGADDVNAPPPRHVHQLQYTGWPDFGVPDDSDPTKGFVRIFTLYRAIRNHLHQQHQAAAAAAGAEGAGAAGGEGAGKSASSSAASAASFSRATAVAAANLPAPIIVHCSAGIGRSGVWIAVDALLDHLSMHTAAGSLPAAFVDMFALVRRMRASRQGMLQTKEQYAYVLHFVATCMQKQLFGVDEKAVAAQIEAAKRKK